MKISIGVLLEFDKQLKHLQENNSVLLLLLRGKTDKFATLFGKHIQRATQKIDALNKEFFVYGEDGRVVMSEPSNILSMDGGQTQQQPEPKMHEGKTMQDYEERYLQIINPVIDVKF
jgi:hypothetical protein